MRVKYLCPLRLVALLLIAGALIILWEQRYLSCYSKFASLTCDHEPESQQAVCGKQNDRWNRSTNEIYRNCIQSIQCIVNGVPTPNCYLTREKDVLVSFEVVRTHLKVFGSLDMSSNTFYLNHANVEVPKVHLYKHNPRGVYMQYNKLSVEKRLHVKLVTADEGVPISSQWDHRGYPYPIQIAQFGLNHFSQLITSYKSGIKDVQNTSSSMNEIMDLDLTISGNNVLHHWTNRKRLDKPNNSLMLSARNVDSNSRSLSITPKLKDWDYFIMVGRQWTYGSFVKLLVQWYPPKTADYHYNHRPRRSSIIYNCSQSPAGRATYTSISSSGNTVIFWMPECEKLAKLYGSVESVKLARDVYTDLVKVFFPFWKFSEHVDSNVKKSRQNNNTSYPFHVQVLEINVYINSNNTTSDVMIEKLRLGKAVNSQTILSDASKREMGSTEKLLHEIRFISAADWFIHHQDKNGAWSVNVRRSLKGRGTLQPGWYSAMGQGQAISLLVRAYNYTGNLLYLRACSRSLDLFNLSIRYGGVRSYFLNQSELIWFEEYPFDPPIHILNGFIYSLIGLHDFTQVAMGNSDPSVSSGLLKAQALLDAGLTSLSKLLPLFDSGSGSFYDLRHLSADYIQPMKETEHKQAKNTYQLSSGPNRARWSYHSLHIQQLRTLIDLDPKRAVQWRNTAVRWTAYLKGFQSLQN
ncbi:unnamed protein product [Trichobilharzia szidati]|nr:unnamed protein product [Trichobilharzia szidati]